LWFINSTRLYPDGASNPEKIEEIPETPGYSVFVDSGDDDRNADNADPD